MRESSLRRSNPVRIAIVGIGNCAKSLLEGIEYYRLNPRQEFGLARPMIGEHRPFDIEYVAAFDIDKRKVGRRLDLAAAAKPNRTVRIAKLPQIGVVVDRGPTLDGLASEERTFVQESGALAADVVSILRASKTEVVVNYLPTGSDQAARFYARAAMKAGCGFINCMPSPIARGRLYKQFVDTGLALLGDDIKSQCGATVVNRGLLELLQARGVHVTSATQVNYGGNADHFNLKFRPASKERSKEAALQSAIHGVSPKVSMHYVDTLYDHKRAEIEIRGRIFGGSPVRLSVLLEDEDSPNSAGVVVDSIRVAGLLQRSGRVHRCEEASAALMKAARRQMPEFEAKMALDQIIEEASCAPSPFRGNK